MDNLELLVETLEPIRLDKYIGDNIEELSRSAAANLIDSGKITLNGAKTNKKAMVKEGDRVEIIFPEPIPYKAEPQDIPLDIVYEDDDLLVVNKPKGMVVHPAAGNYDSTLVNSLLFHCGSSLSGINGVLRPGIVHRIDKNTSGLLIVAKNDNSHRHLAEQIKEHSFKREYEAVVVGNIKEDKGTINLPIGRHPVKRKQMAVTDRNSKNAVTHFEVLNRFKGFTHLRLTLETGRTHQIRVHLSHLGHPVVGDDVYGKEYKGMAGQCLHAKTIGFIHPDGRYLEFTSDLPDYFKDFLRKLNEKI